MEIARSNRRRLLQSGAGALAALAAARAGVLTPSAGARSGRDDIIPGELRLFAGDYAPRGWRRVDKLTGRGLMGSGDPPDGPARRLGEHGNATVVRDPGPDPSSLDLTYLTPSEPDPEISEMVGEIRSFAFDVAPQGWIPCEGQELKLAQYTTLFAVFANTFGGDGRTTFWLPDLRGRTPVDAGEVAELPPAPFAKGREDLAPSGEGRAPRLHLNYCIAHRGQFPERSR